MLLDVSAAAHPPPPPHTRTRTHRGEMAPLADVFRLFLEIDSLRSKRPVWVSVRVYACVRVCAVAVTADADKVNLNSKHKR